MSWRKKVRRVLLRNRLANDLMLAGFGVVGLVAALVAHSIWGIVVAGGFVVAFGWGARSTYRDLSEYDAKD
jgi:hypothetical protein